MGRSCCIYECKRGWVDGVFRGFRFPLKKQDIVNKWIEFVDRPNWDPNPAQSLICHEHFDPSLIIRGDTRWSIKWKLSPVPTLYPPSGVRPRKRQCVVKAENEHQSNLQLAVKFDNFSSSQAPDGFRFRRRKDDVIFYNLHFDDETGIPAIHECIKVDSELHVQLQFKGSPVPLPSWFCKESRATITSYSQLDEFVVYLRSMADSSNETWFYEELRSRLFYKGTKPFSNAMLRFGLLLRSTSTDAYNLMLDMLPLPSNALLRKIQREDKLDNLGNFKVDTNIHSNNHSNNNSG